MMTTTNLKSENQLSPLSILIWRIVQLLVWFVGAFILLSLILYPSLGINLFWNILIPIAPALLVVAVGVWRNVCPMATTALFFRHIGLSKRKILTIDQVGKLNFISVVALFIIVPLRHAIFNVNGLATAILIISLAAIAVIVGLRYEWKSAWCSGLCPVHPVEKLYGINNRFSLPNAHCGNCHRCVTPCPDSTHGINPMSSKKTLYHRMSGFLMVAAFPGFVWGWFQVQDFSGTSGLYQMLLYYKMPLIGLLVSSIIYLILVNIVNKKILMAVFAAASVSCYYWFRIPALFGYGVFRGDGMLVNLTEVLPEWSMIIVVLITTLFFFWWIVFRKNNKRSWIIRPVYANKLGEIG